MPAVIDCCHLVGELDCSPYCLTSISMNTNTEVSNACGPEGDPIIGPTIATLNITGYAKEGVHYGCDGEAGVSINWIRKYDCINDITYFIFSHEGESHYYGDVGNYVELHREVNQYRYLSASVGSGPANLYVDQIRHDGYGMTYTGGPISFSTDVDGGVQLNEQLCGIGEPPMYLTNFTVNFPMGDVPTASYTFVYSISNVVA